MKTLQFILFFLLLGISYQSNAQTRENPTPIYFTIDGLGYNDSYALEPGYYIVFISGNYDPDSEQIDILFDYKINAVEQIQNDIKEKSGDEIGLESITTYEREFTFKLKRRSEVTIKVTRTKKEKKETAPSKKFTTKTITKADGTKETETTEEEVITEGEDSFEVTKQEFNFKMAAKNHRKWHTTIGLAGVYNFNSDTYKTRAEGDKFIITEDGSQQLIDPIPMMLFTYLDLEKDNAVGWSGGIGFDTENFSIFFGGSYYIGHNLILTAGAALHKQKRLDNKYDVGQIVDAAIDSNDLNTEYFRVNPFISLTFNLSNNPFRPASSSNNGDAGTGNADGGESPQ